MNALKYVLTFTFAYTLGTVKARPIYALLYYTPYYLNPFLYKARHPIDDEEECERIDNLNERLYKEWHQKMKDE